MAARYRPAAAPLAAALAVVASAQAAALPLVGTLFGGSGARPALDLAASPLSFVLLVTASRCRRQPGRRPPASSSACSPSSSGFSTGSRDRWCAGLAVPAGSAVLAVAGLVVVAA
jgi:hypothetical protein